MTALGSTTFSSRYARSERLAPVMSGPTCPPLSNSLWHWAQVLVNSARPWAALAGVGFDDVSQQVRRVRAVGAGDVGPDLPAAVEQPVALGAGLGEQRPAVGRAGRGGGARLDDGLQRRHPLELVLARLLHDAP